MKTKRTQNQQVLRHLQRRGSITAMQAAFEYGILRLAARISDLEKLGMNIKHETVFPDKKQPSLHIAKYSLV